MKAFFQLIIGGFLVFVISCKKTDETKALDFSYSGDLYVFSTLTFQSNQPAGTPLKWEFGDKMETTDATPQHSFDLKRTYTVKLTANGQSVSKDISLTNGLFRVNNYKKWFRVESDIGYMHSYHQDSVYDFSVTATNDSTIAIPAEKVTYTGNLQQTIVKQLPADSDSYVLEFKNANASSLSWHVKSNYMRITRVDYSINRVIDYYSE